MSEFVKKISNVECVACKTLGSAEIIFFPSSRFVNSLMLAFTSSKKPPDFIARKISSIKADKMASSSVCF
jgi:hypothetical protein